MKKKVLSLLLLCTMILSACGENEKAAGTEEITVEEAGIPYVSNEMSLPDSLLTESAQGSDYIGDDFQGFVSDLQGLPAVYYSNVTIEAQEYYATLTRWTLDKDDNWESEELCENSLSDFLNNKFEQVDWKRCELNNFRRGDNASLYAVFSYMVEEDQEIDGELTEVVRQRYSILEIDEENDRIFEIPLELDSGVQDEFSFEQRTGLDWISDYHAFDDGTILLLSSDDGGGYGYLINGETGQVIKDLGSVVAGKRRFAFGESEMIFYSNDIKKFQVLNIEDMGEQNTFGGNLSPDELGKDWFFYVNPDTWEVFLLNGQGVYRALNYQAADEVQCLTDKTDMSELEQGESQILDFFVGAQEDFYICLMETTELYGEETRSYRMLHYRKEE